MDLRSLVLDFGPDAAEAPRVEVAVRDAQGEERRALSPGDAREVFAAAAPFMDALDALLGCAAGRPLHLGLDADAREVRVRGGARDELISGAEYEALLPALRQAARSAVRKVRPRKADLESPRSAAELWEHKYTMHSDGWELGRAAPPLVRFFAEHPLAPGTRAIVPGAGRGHEARLLARRGARVLAVDIAPSAISEATRLADAEGLLSRIEVRQADFLDLPRELPGAFDLLVEHCCFCAIDPGLRGAYVEAASALLAPGGELLGLFFCHDDAGGPPYGSTPEEVERRFAARFDRISREVPRDSVPTRAGQELLLHLKKR